MLVPVFITRDDKHSYLATAPDFSGCIARGTELGRTITRIHLQLEGRVSEMLINGEALPEIGSAKDQLPSVVADSGQFFDIHINLVHLAAVAKHQRRVRPVTPGTPGLGKR